MYFFPEPVRCLIRNSPTTQIGKTSGSECAQVHAKYTRRRLGGRGVYFFPEPVRCLIRNYSVFARERLDARESSTGFTFFLGATKSAQNSVLNFSREIAITFGIKTFLPKDPNHRASPFSTFRSRALPLSYQLRGATSSSTSISSHVKM